MTDATKPYGPPGTCPTGATDASHECSLDWCGYLPADEEPENEHPDIEVTVGVMVPMTWDAADECYKVSGKLTITNGGLFSDAEDSSWVPSEDSWGGDRPVEAERLVARLIAQH